MKRLSLLLACMLAVSVWCAAPAAAAEGYTLEVDEATGTVTGYTGTLPAVLVIPAGVRAIGEDALSRNGDLEELVLPEGLTDIGRGAFIACTNLREVAWPQTLVNIGNAAFCGTDLRSLELPQSVRTLSWGAFNNCQALKSVAFPDGLAVIGTNSFRGCTSLTDVRIPEGVQYLGGFSFANCTSLTEIRLPSSLRSLQDGVFKGCSELQHLVIPEGPRFLSYTFDGCSALETVSIPESVVQIEGSVFRKCDRLKTIRYGGTEEAWTKALSYGNSTVNSSVEIIFGGSAAPSLPPEPTAAPSGPVDADFPYLKPGTGYAIRNEGGQEYFVGPPIGNGDGYTSVYEVVSAFEVPAGAALEVLAGDAICNPDAPIATGNTLQLLSVRGESVEAAVVVSGDVLGNGMLTVSQLVRMARALNGSVPLTGPFLKAGCVTGGTTLTISDLVQMAHMLTE